MTTPPGPPGAQPTPPREAARRVKAVFVDPQPADAAMLADLLRASLEPVGCVAELEDAVGLVEVSDADVAVVSLGRDHREGIDVVKSLRASFPFLKIVTLTPAFTPAGLGEAIAAGVDAYLLKTAKPERLASAIAGISGGDVVVAREVVDRAMEEPRRTPPRQTIRLL